MRTKGADPEKAIFTQTGSVSNTVSSLGQGAVSAAVLSGPHNVIMGQKGFRQVGAADELPMQFPTSGLVVNESKLKSDADAHQECDPGHARRLGVLPQRENLDDQLHP